MQELAGDTTYTGAHRVPKPFPRLIRDGPAVCWEGARVAPGGRQAELARSILEDVRVRWRAGAVGPPACANLAQRLLNAAVEVRERVDPADVRAREPAARGESVSGTQSARRDGTFGARRRSTTLSCMHR